MWWPPPPPAPCWRRSRRPAPTSASAAGILRPGWKRARPAIPSARAATRKPWPRGAHDRPRGAGRRLPARPCRRAGRGRSHRERGAGRLFVLRLPGSADERVGRELLCPVLRAALSGHGHGPHARRGAGRSRRAVADPHPRARRTRAVAGAVTVSLANVAQGSPAWLDLRRQHYGASELPAIGGLSPYQSAAEVWRAKLGRPVARSISDLARRIGHALEPLALELAAESLGALTLRVAVLVQDGGLLLASLDAAL